MNELVQSIAHVTFMRFVFDYRIQGDELVVGYSIWSSQRTTRSKVYGEMMIEEGDLMRYYLRGRVFDAEAFAHKDLDTFTWIRCNHSDKMIVSNLMLPQDDAVLQIIQSGKYRELLS